MKRRKLIYLLGLASASGGLAIACSSGSSSNNSSETPATTSQATPTAAATPAGAEMEKELVVYSGREEKLIGELVEKFKVQTGANIQVRYGDTAELAAAILEEQQNSPADVFFAQDASALGAIQKASRSSKLSETLLSKVPERYRSPEGQWVGISGRMRTVDYNTDLVKPDELPTSIFGLTDPKWQGQIGWAPTNASFQSFVTALRVSQGEEKAKEWLEGMKANEPKVYPKNTPIIEALSRGEIAIGLVNHYYLEKFKKENPNAPVAHHYTDDVGSLINVAGVAILNSAKHPNIAQKFIEFLLGEEGQQYFSSKTYEYPLVAGISASSGLKALDEVKYAAIDLSNLDDLEGTLKLLQDSGVL